MITAQHASRGLIKLSLAYAAFGITALAAAQIVFFFSGQALFNGIYRSPAFWSFAHLLLLGCGMSVAMGAMTQLVPVSLLTKLWNERIAYWHFVFTIAGMLSLIMALGFRPALGMHAGLLLLVGIGLFVLQMGMTLRKARKNIVFVFTVTALFFLLLTVLAGWALTLRLAGIPPGIEDRLLFRSHILFGLFGWFHLLIIGFSYQLVPMFTLSHGFSLKPGYVVYGSQLIGITSALLFFYTEQTLWASLSAVSLIGGIGLFLWHLGQIMKKRMRKRVDIGVIVSLSAAFICMPAAGLIFTSALALPLSWLAAGLYLFVMGWVILSIMGYVCKIVPFLSWTDRYAHRAGESGIPHVNDLLRQKAIKRVFILYIPCLFGIAAAIAFEASFLFYVLQPFAAGLTGIYGWLILQPLLKRREKGGSFMVEKQRILDALREVYDPELGINVVDLGLIYDIEVDETDRVQVTMTLTTPGCPLHDSIVGAVERRLRDLQIFRDVRVDLVWNPPWTPERISEEALEELKK